MVAFRADYYGRFAAFPAFARLLAESQLLVGPMTDAEVHAAIEEPAHRGGLTLEAGLADAIAADVAGPAGRAPVAVDGTAGDLGAPPRPRCSPTPATTTPAASAARWPGSPRTPTCSSHPTSSARAGCSCCASPSPARDSDDVRRRVPLVELGDDARVLQTLVARRLVTTGDGTAEVAHEALLREWPRLRSWLEEDRDGRRLHHRVAAAAIDWDTSGRDPTELYRGTRLEAALDWSATHPGEANPLEREFLEAAGAAHDHELRTARRDGPPAAVARRRPRRPARSWPWSPARSRSSSDGDANRQATRANRRRHARTGDPARDTGPHPAGDADDLALLLGVEGRRLQPSLTTDGGLEAAITHRPAGLERVLHFDTPAAYANLSDDDRLLAAPGNDGNIRIYDFTTGRLLHTLRGDGEPALVALFNHDASLVVTGGIHGKVTDLARRHRQAHRTTRHAGGNDRLRRLRPHRRALHRQRQRERRAVGSPRPRASDPDRRALHGSRSARTTCRWWRSAVPTVNLMAAGGSASSSAPRSST